MRRKKISEVTEKVFGKSSIKGKVALRAFFGGLLCYILRRPKDIPEETFVKNLIDMIVTWIKNKDVS